MYEGDRFGGETISALGKAAPPVAVSVGTVAGMTLEQWVLIVTLIYTLSQLVYLGYKVARDVRRDRAERR